MDNTIRRVSYFRCTVHDKPGEAYRLLSLLAEKGVNLLAFTAVPIGPAHTQLTIFPDEKGRLENEARGARIKLDGPYPAVLVQGSDQVGVLADIHEHLYDAGINIFASYAVADGEGDFGYIIYVSPDKFDRVAKTLGI